MEPRLQTPSRPWYASRSGKIFLIFLGILLTLGGIFASLVGYYIIQIKKGNGLEIAEQLQGSNSLFSSTESRESQTDRIYSRPEIDAKIKPNNPKTATPESPIQLVMFIDFECPYSQLSYPMIKEIEDKFGPAIDVIFKHFPLESIHPQAVAAANAGECAREQGKFWQYYDAQFENPTFNESALVTRAGDLGMNTIQFTGCLRTQKYMGLIEQDIADGRALGVRGTPTYFVNTTKVEGLRNAELWNQLLLKEIQTR